MHLISARKKTSPLFMKLFALLAFCSLNFTVNFVFKIRCILYILELKNYVLLFVHVQFSISIFVFSIIMCARTAYYLLAICGRKIFAHKACVKTGFIRQQENTVIASKTVGEDSIFISITVGVNNLYLLGNQCDKTVC